MIVVPSITLKQGQCVSIHPGSEDANFVVSDDPIDLAGRWMDKGAEFLHVYDLDYARSGDRCNLPIISDLAQRFPNFQIQVAGGIKDLSSVEVYFGAGVRLVVLEEACLASIESLQLMCRAFPKRVSLNIDVNQDGRFKAISVEKLSGLALKSIILTDLRSVGTADGVNIEQTVALANRVDAPLWACGGVADLDDIKALYSEADAGIEGVLVGRAFAEGRLNFQEALAYCAE